MFTDREIPTTTIEAMSYADAALAIVNQIRAFGQIIPKFVIPDSRGASQRMAAAASLPPEFVELATVAIRTSGWLQIGNGPDPDRIHDLMSFASAFGPVADEMEAMAYFIRHTVIAARNAAGSDALITYNLAQRLSRRRESADLIPHVDHMRRALGKRFRKAKSRPAPESPAPSASTE